MATPGQIQIYSPARQLPPGFIGRNPPVRRPTADQRGAMRRAAAQPVMTGRWAALNEYANTPEAQARAKQTAKEAADAFKQSDQYKDQQKQQKAAQDAAYDQLPWWKKGLATILDNPGTKLLLAPAEALSVPMKAVALGKEELSAHLPYGLAKRMEDPFNVGRDRAGAQPVMRALDFLSKVIPASPLGVDTDKARADQRSVGERLAPRSDFGHGQIQTSTGNQWGNRFQGLGADMLNDPLMLLEGGGTVTRPAIAGEDALKALGRGERLALSEGQRALMTPERAAADAAERAASAMPTGVRTAEEEIARQAAGRGSAEARFADNIHRPRLPRAEAEIPLPKNLQERMNLASEWATENPGLWREHQSEVSKGIKRGFESMSPEAKSAFGVKTGGISVRGLGVELPGSEALRQVWKDAGGARRAATSDVLDKLPKEGTWDKVRNMRIPKGQESSYAALRRAGTSAEEAELALNNVFVRNQIDIGKGQMKAKGAVHLRKTLRELRDKYSNEEIAQLVREAETTGTPNQVNQLFKNLAAEHEKLTGRKLVSSISGDTYLPHTLDSKWRRFMLANPDDPFVKSFMNANGIVKDDLLEASHYLDKSRKLRVPEGKAEAEFDFAGRKVTLKGNTVAAKNEAMHEAFPEWKGDFYSTDLGTIGESYLDSLSNDAGAHYARQQLANTKSPFVRTLDGMLWDEYQKMNDTLAQRPYARRVTDVTEQGYKTGTGVEDIAPSPAEPTSEYFRKEKDVKATEQLAEDVQGAGRQWRRDMANDATDVYEKAQEDVSTLRRTWGEGLRDEAKAGNPRIKRLQKQIEKYQEYAKAAKLKLGKMTSDDADELVKVLANVDDHIAFLKRELSNTKRTFNGKITRESKKVDNELAAELRKLTKVRADLEEHVANVGPRLRAEIEERRAWINGDVAEKEAALAAKEKTVPKPSPADPEVMDGILARTDGKLPPPIPNGVSEFKSHPAYERMVDDYSDALRALQRSREDGRVYFKNGKVTPEGRKLVDEVQAAQKALREVQGALTPAEFERVFAAHEAATVAIKDVEDELAQMQRFGETVLPSGVTADELKAKLPELRKAKDEADAELQKVYDIQKQRGRPYEQEVNGRKVLTNADTDIVQHVGVDKQGRGRYKVGDWRIEPTTPETVTVKVRDGGPVRKRTAKHQEPRWKVISPDGNVSQATMTYEAAKNYALAGHLNDMEAPAFYFHGTGNPIDELTTRGGGDPFAQLNGAGLYTTESPDLGREYRRKTGQTDRGEVYRVSTPKGKHLDLEAPMPTDARVAINEVIGSEVRDRIGPRPPAAGDPPVPDGYVRVYGGNSDPPGWYLVEPELGSQEYLDFDTAKGMWFTTDRDRAMRGSGQYGTQSEVHYRDIPADQFEQLKGMANVPPEHQQRLAGMVPDTDIVLPEDMYWNMPDDMQGISSKQGKSSMPHDVLDELYDFLSDPNRHGDDALRGIRESLQMIYNSGAMTKAEAEDVLWKINAALEGEGYVALKHTGGALMGGGRDHNVKIWLDPGKVKITDVMDKEGSYTNHMRELAKARGEFEGLGGADAYPNGAPPRHEIGTVARRAGDTSDAYKEWRLWQTTKEDIQDMERKLQRGGEFHGEQQARNWATHQANYNNTLADATKEERAAVEAARAGRDARAGQRESIVRSGPEVGNQNWPTESTNQVRAAEQAVATKAAEVPRPHSRQQVEKARQLEAEEKRLYQLRYEGSMTPEEYARRMEKLNAARERQLEDIKLISMKDKPPGEMNRLRNQIESNHSIATRRLTEQYEARLPAEEFDRRMAVVQNAKARLKMGPRTASTEATDAAREAARQRLALQQQAPSRVVDPEAFQEGAMVKPTLPQDVKAVKHGQGHFVLEHPDSGEIYSIDVDRASKRPKWDVTLPNGEGQSFPTLREATEYARDDMARGLATTEAQRAALPPMTPDAYAEATGAVARSEKGRRAAVTAKINRQPGTADILSAEQWYKANVRAATGPEREALNRAKTYAKQRERFAAATPEPDPRWVEPLGGFGYDERRLPPSAKPTRLGPGQKDILDAFIETAERRKMTPAKAIEHMRKNMQGIETSKNIDMFADAMADHYYAASHPGELGIQRHVERINTPPQPAAFESSAVSAETGQLVGVPPPRTEGEAVSHLESQLQPGTTDIVPGSELHNKVVAPFEQAKAVEEQYASEIPFKSAEAKERINKEFGAERDQAIGDISTEQGVFKNLKDDLTERESLLRKRKELTDLKDRLMATPARSRNEELLSVIEQLEEIAKANPLLDDAQLNAAESLLHTHKEALERIAKAERLRFQVKNLEDMAKNGKLEDVFRAVLNENWKAMHDGLLAKGDVIIDHRLATALQNIYEISKEPGLFGRTFNAFTNLFKTYATLSPGFQVRNILSGMFMNTADGVGLRTQMEGAQLWRKWERGGVEWLDRQPQRIQDAFAASFASGAGGRVAEAGVAGKSANRVYDKLSNNFATRRFQQWGEKAEGSLRLGMALHSMDRGEGVASAVRRIGRVHFNYAEVSALDEQAKRLIPFWTFMSRNLPLQLQEIFTNPAAYAAYGHIKRNFEGAKEENTPEYWKGLGTWRLPFDIGGQSAYFQPDFGFTRMGQDIENITDTVTMKKPLAFMNSVNPGFSAPLDFLYSQDSFTGRKYGPTDYSKMSGPVGAITQVLASIAGQTNEAGQVSDNFQNFMRSINPLQDRVTRLAPGAVGGDSDPRRLAESWGRFIGVPVRQLSPKQQEAEAMRKYYAMLDEAKRQKAMSREEAS